MGGLMSEERRRYSAEFKREAVRRMAGCENVMALARELGIRRKFLYQWRDQLHRQGEQALERGPGRPPGRKTNSGAKRKPAVSGKANDLQPLQKRIAELERQLGIKQLELDFFKRTFEHVRGEMRSPAGTGDKRSTGASKRRSRSKEQD
jgi:transposase-like protein